MTIKISQSQTIPKLKKTEDKTSLDIRYMLISPYVSVHIYWDPNISETIYEVEEPILNQKDAESLIQLEEGMREVINVDLLIDKNIDSIVEYLEKTSRVLINEMGLKVSEESFNRIFYYIYRDFVGLNKIEPLLKDYFIEDIECNGINTPIYIIHRLYRNLKTNIVYKDLDEITSFVEKLAQRCGKYISYASPLLDGSLPDGSRINATYTTDVSSRGPTFTIRKFTKIPWTPVQLLAMNTLSPEMLAYFWILTQYKCNILIAGGTASGKTTLLNAIAFFIPPDARVVSIEDTRELNLPRENWLPSVARSGMGLQGIGEVDLFALLRSSFRQNPDYVIVGEVRGKEASVLFQGMASGHSSLSTMHADSVDTLIKRLETPPIELSPTLVNTLDAVSIMTHAVVKGQETRRLREIVEIVNVTPEGIAMTNTPFAWNPADDRFYFKKNSTVFDKIIKRTGIPKEELSKEFELRTKLLYKLFQQKLNDYEEIQKIVNEYYKHPQDVLKRFGIV